MTRAEFALAYEQGIDATKRLIQSRGAELSLAEEIAQAAWTRGWEYLDQLRDPSLVLYWVNSIATNLFRSQFRHTAFEQLEIDRHETGFEPNEMLRELEVTLLLSRITGTDLRLIRKYLEGYSAKEIAEVEGISGTGIRVRQLRIRQWLREALQNYSQQPQERDLEGDPVFSAAQLAELRAKANYLKGCRYVPLGRGAAVQSIGFWLVLPGKGGGYYSVDLS